MRTLRRVNMFESYEGMPPIPAVLREEYVDYDIDLSMGEINTPQKKAAIVASVTWASCIE